MITTAENNCIALSRYIQLAHLSWNIEMNKNGFYRLILKNVDMHEKAIKC